MDIVAVNDNDLTKQGSLQKSESSRVERWQPRGLKASARSPPSHPYIFHRFQAVGSVYNGDVSAVTRKLQERNIYFVAGREAPGQQVGRIVQSPQRFLFLLSLLFRFSSSRCTPYCL